MKSNNELFSNIKKVVDVALRVGGSCAIIAGVGIKANPSYVEVPTNNDPIRWTTQHLGVYSPQYFCSDSSIPYVEPRCEDNSKGSNYSNCRVDFGTNEIVLDFFESTKSCDQLGFTEVSVNGTKILPTLPSQRP